MRFSVDDDLLFARYRELQDYVGWSADDAERVRCVLPMIESAIPKLVDDFYAAIDRNDATRKVITGGLEQVEHLKGTLTDWMHGLLSGEYDSTYVTRRWQAGYRHVEIGLEQVYTNAALSRVRFGLTAALRDNWDGPPDELWETAASLHKLLDLDLAIIEDAYQAEYTDRLQKTERLATLGQVAAGVAHELRNPLNAVRTSVYYLQNAQCRPPEKTAEHLQRIDRQVELAGSVVSALANFAKLPSPHLRSLCLSEWVDDLLETQQIPSGIELEIDCPEGLPHLQADPSQLYLALSHLIRNAVDAMPKGGSLLLRGRRVGDTVELEVIDTGAGIPPDKLERIMEPLYSTKTRGIGLGLAITRTILEKHHGGLRVQSHPGQGTTFTVRVPAVPQT